MDWIVKLLVQIFGWSVIVILSVIALLIGIAYLFSSPEERRAFEEDSRNIDG